MIPSYAPGTLDKKNMINCDRLGREMLYGNLEMKKLTTGWRKGFMAKATFELSLDEAMLKRRRT